MLLTDVAKSGDRPVVSGHSNELRGSKEGCTDEGPYRRHYEASMEVHVVGRSGRQYPAQIEIEHVNSVWKSLVHVWVIDVRHFRELHRGHNEILIH